MEIKKFDASKFGHRFFRYNYNTIYFLDYVQPWRKKVSLTSVIK